MKVVICTTPIRPEPTPYPPFGSMALVDSLRSAGYDPYFYDIDGVRPTFEEVIEFFREHAPDVVGISSVVSTAYAYTKKLALAIKEVSPETKIVVGGNLSASAEVLLRCCKIDVCGIGEGEKVIVNLVGHWESHSGRDDYDQLGQIKGITYLNRNDEVEFTGYEAPIPADEFLCPDWTILDQYSRIENFIIDPLSRSDFAQDPRSHEPHRRGKMLATAITAKGCVCRCTFCHRWDRGYRHWPVDRIMETIQSLINRYNVGFFCFSDENFGSDRGKLEELIERIKPLDILYQVGGVRCRSVDPEVLSELKDSGCVAVYYGMETGSPQMLEVMEKRTNLQQNLDAARWTHEAGIYTIYQLVLGMPGETHQTISETSEFIREVTEFLPQPPHKTLSINYIQALPGTAVYEYARDSGLIGTSIEEEEQYLIMISDIDATDDTKFLNFTEEDYLTIQTWRPRIVLEAEMNWYRKRGWKAVPSMPDATGLNRKLPDTDPNEDYNQGGYFNLGHSSIRHPLLYRFLATPLGYPFRAMYPAAYALAKDIKGLTVSRWLTYVWEYVSRKLVRRRGLQDIRSLRKVMKDRTSLPVTTSERSMLPLREGR